MLVKKEDFERYRRTLTKYALSFTKKMYFNNKENREKYFTNLETAKDLVQDTYLAFHYIIAKNKEFFNDENHLIGGLKTILKRKAIKLRTDGKYNSKKRVDEILYPRILPEVNPKYMDYHRGEEKLFIEDIHKCLYNTVARKDDKGAEMTLLHCAGYSAEEIANEYNVSEHSVCQSMYKTRVKFKNLYYA